MKQKEKIAFGKGHNKRYIHYQYNCWELVMQIPEMKTKQISKNTYNVIAICFYRHR